MRSIPVLEITESPVTSCVSSSNSSSAPTVVTSSVSTSPSSSASGVFSSSLDISYYLVNVAKESCTRLGSIFLQRYLENLSISSEDTANVEKMFKQLFPSAIKSLMMDEYGSCVINKLFPRLTLQQLNLILAVEIINKDKTVFLQLATNPHAVTPLTTLFEVLHGKLDKLSKSSSSPVSSAAIANLLNNIRSMFRNITQLLHEDKGKALFELCLDPFGQKTILSFFSQLPSSCSSHANSSRSTTPPVCVSSDRNLLINDLLNSFGEISKSDVGANSIRSLLIYFHKEHFEILLPLIESSLIPYSLTSASVIIIELLDHPLYGVTLLRMFMKEVFASSTVKSFRQLFLSSYGRSIILKLIMIIQESDFVIIQQFVGKNYQELIAEYDGANDDVEMIMDAIHGRKMSISCASTLSSFSMKNEPGNSVESSASLEKSVAVCFVLFILFLCFRCVACLFLGSNLPLIQHQ
jgi:hypothetical protein